MLFGQVVCVARALRRHLVLQQHWPVGCNPAATADNPHHCLLWMAEPMGLAHPYHGAHCACVLTMC